MENKEEIIPMGLNEEQKPSQICILGFAEVSVLLSAIASAAKLFFPECDPSPSPSTFSHLLQVLFGLYFSSCSVTLTSFSAEPGAFVS